jgi:hypothetical protein
MRILDINNDGGGSADHIEIEEIEAGTTVSALFATKLPDRLPGDYLIRVNRQGNLSRQQGKPKRPFRRNQSRLRKKKNPQVFIFIKSLRVFRLEAGGIEPPSRDNSNGGLYMHSRCFNLDPGDGHRHSSPESSRLFLA